MGLSQIPFPQSHRTDPRATHAPSPMRKEVGAVGQKSEREHFHSKSLTVCTHGPFTCLHPTTPTRVGVSELVLHSLPLHSFQFRGRALGVKVSSVRPNKQTKVPVWSEEHE